MKRIIPGVILTALLAGCGGGSAYKKGQMLLLTGTVDNVARQDVSHDKRLLTFTSVGMTSGQGVTLLGLQPGIGRGKNMRITAEFMENINGTDVFTAKLIEAEAAPPPAPATPEPVSAPSASMPQGGTSPVTVQ